MVAREPRDAVTSEANLGGLSRQLARFPMTRPTRNTLFLLSWIGLLFLAHWEALGLHHPNSRIDPVEAFFFEADESVPILHFAAFAFVLWHRRRAIGEWAPGRSSTVGGILLGALGVALFGWARYSGQIDLLIDSLTILVAAGGLYRAGWRGLSLLVLPLAILWLARPWPPMLLHSLHETLQAWTGSMADLLLSPLGEVTRSGHLMHFRGRNFEVIEGCSGLRGTTTMVFAALCYAEFVSRSRRQTLGLVAMAVVLGMVVNVLRVGSIMLMPGADLSQDHSIQGLVMISVGVVLLGSVDALADRFVWPPGSREWRTPTRASGASSIGWRSWTLLALAGVLAISSFFSVARKPPATQIWKLHEIRREMGPWHLDRRHEMDHAHLGSVDFRDHFDREYVRGSDRVRLFVGADDPTRRDQSGLSPKTRLLGNAWERVEADRLTLPDTGRQVERIRQRAYRAEELTFHFREGFDSLPIESIRWYFALDLLPGAEPVDSLVVRLSTPIVKGNVPAAQHVLTEFMNELEKDLQRAKPSSARE